MTRHALAILAAIAVCAGAATAQSSKAQAKADSIAKARGTKQAPAPLPTKQEPAAVQKSAPPASKAGAAQAPAQAPAQAAGQAPAAAAKPQQGGPSEMSLQREVFSYSDGGRRDPMASLMTTGDIRPLITEVKVIGIYYDEEGSNSSALLLNIVDKKTQYRVKVGQMLGRMKVTQITRKEVVFTLDEFGFSRQERLAVKADTTVARTP